MVTLTEDDVLPVVSSQRLCPSPCLSPKQASSGPRGRVFFLAVIRNLTRGQSLSSTTETQAQYFNCPTNSYYIFILMYIFMHIN